MAEISHILPIDRPDCHNQKEQTEVTDEEYFKLFKTPELTTSEKIKKFVCFIVFLGPIKIVGIGLSLLAYSLMAFVLNLFERFFRHQRAYKEFAFKVLWPIVRVAFFFSGFVKVNIHGQIDPNTRVIVCNHTSLFDIIAMLMSFPVAFTAKKSLKNWSIIQQAAAIYDIIFIDRTKNQRVSDQIVDYINDPSYLPLCIFPEGKITNGTALLGFRTGAFLTEHQVQPITMRYTHWFNDMRTSNVTWLESVPKYVYKFCSCPFVTLDIVVHPPFDFKGQNLTPAEKAKIAQLYMANYLGVPAYDKTNKLFFEKQEQFLKYKIE